MILAEEMDLDWSTIKIEQALESEGTGGSRSIRGLWKPLRKAGATAKDMLLEAAAQEWKVEKSDCVAENGMINHKPTGK
jgi:isoquinoline 1-oxidoreductase beta subunit